ncbi:unnamed protein product [Moneuplotes crassus]|uniref:Uncharacterized protein n=1 Tax=Euplotes crassus TaxID=5936 RepID=A0AAD2D102_EUPCR|nr:unnamed protein product [Moneuplotes crassus]
MKKVLRNEDLETGRLRKMKNNMRILNYKLSQLPRKNSRSLL